MPLEIMIALEFEHENDKITQDKLYLLKLGKFNVNLIELGILYLLKVTPLTS